MLTHHTLEVPNAFLYPKILDHPTKTIEVSTCGGGGEVGLRMSKIASKGPTMITKFDATSRYLDLSLFKFNTQFQTVGIPLLPFMN